MRVNEITVKRVMAFLKARLAPRGAKIAFAQYGEDLIMKEILKKHRLSARSYIDIGTHHPYFANNTYLFYRDGGRGVLVEPNAALCEVIRRKRPQDSCLNAGIGKTDGEAEFYLFPQSTRSTFSREQAEEYARNSGQRFVKEVHRIYSLDTIVAKYFGEKSIAAVSIDAEGLDFEILSSYSFTNRPNLFCVELAEGDSRVQSLLSEKGYELVARVFQNAIFLDREVKR